MQITPKPVSAVPSNEPLTTTITQKTAHNTPSRERAMAAFMNGVKPPQTNQTQVAVEELAAASPTPAAAEAAPAPESAPKVEEPKVEDTPLSAQYAQLARKEKALRMKQYQAEQALKAKEAEFAAREASIKAKEQEYEANYIPKSRIKENTWEVLSENDISYDKLAAEALNQPSPEVLELRRVLAQQQAKIDALEQGTKKTEQRLEESQTQAYKQAVNQIRMDATQLVNADPSYESIKTTGQVEEVVKLIQETFDKEGILLSVEEAAQEVENEITEQFYNYASKINKIKSRFQPSATAPGTAPKQTGAKDESVQQQQPQMKTLTNAVGATRKLSARERAVLAFKGELGKSGA